MQKKNLLLITQGFPFGESERGFLLSEFTRLTEQFQVTVLAIGNKDPLVYPVPESVQLERYYYKPIRQAKSAIAAAQIFKNAAGEIFREARLAKKNCTMSQTGKRYMQCLADGLNAWQIRQRMREIIQQNKIEIVYTYWCTPATLAAVFLKKEFPALKVITRFHGFDLYQERDSYGYQAFRPFIAQQCERLIFACETSKKYFLEQWGSQWEDKCMTSYLGCRPFPPVFTQMEDTLVMVSCAFMIPRKRIDMIIDALAALPDNVKVQWHHIGNGPLAKELKAKTEALLGPKTGISWKFWGHVLNEELPELYQKIKPHLYITTASTEGGAPVAIQEIFSAGVPAIGVNVGGIPELVQNGRTGYLLSETPAIEELAYAIKDFYMATPQQRQAMSDGAYDLWQTSLDAQKNAVRFVQELERMVMN